MALNFEVVTKSPATTKAVGIPVSSEGALPKEVTLSRATLESLGFTGKVGQTYVVPAEKGVVSILVGVGVVSKLDTASLRKASAAFARAAAGFESVSAHNHALETHVWRSRSASRECRYCARSV